MLHRRLEIEKQYFKEELTTTLDNVCMVNSWVSRLKEAWGRNWEEMAVESILTILYQMQQTTIIGGLVGASRFGGQVPLYRAQYQNWFHLLEVSAYGGELQRPVRPPHLLGGVTGELLRTHFPPSAELLTDFSHITPPCRECEEWISFFSTDMADDF